MRERYLEVFNRIWIDNLHGDRFGSERAPDGRTSESIFAMQGSSGIQLGTAIALLLTKAKGSTMADVRYRDFSDANAEDRRASLLKHAVANDPNDAYTTFEPVLEFDLPFKPIHYADSYLRWAPLDELLSICSPGVNTSRDALVVDIDLQRLTSRMELYFNSAISDQELGEATRCAVRDSARFNARQTREYLLHRGLQADKFLRYAYRPFDSRYLYWEPETKLLDEKREQLFSAHEHGTTFIICREKAERQQEGTPFYLTRSMSDRHLTRPGCICFAPLRLSDQQKLSATQSAQTTVPEQSRTYLSAIAVPTETGEPYEILAMHVAAVGYSPSYLAENADVIRLTWPRIPLPDSKLQLQISAALGHKSRRPA